VNDRIDAEGLAKPAGFSHAVRVAGGPTGRPTVYLAGQTALDETGAIVGENVVEQFERALRNLLTALEAAGGRPTDLVTMTVYVVDMDDYRAHSREIGKVWKRLVGNEYPAMAGIGVARLWDVEALVEVQGVAVVGPQEDETETRSDVRELRLALTVDDLDGSVASYRDGLGMGVVASWDHPSGRGVVLDAGRATIELLEAGHAAYVDDIEVGRAMPSTVRVALQVDEAETAANRLAAAGAERLGAAVVTPWNSLNVRMSTPEGVQLTLFSENDD
jgi:enamine deaminase RidA (YjgF/YER057c/UK114 family)/catechol 2,3-dioxygenase-like lactoylglutathione lyase family enzyme